MVGLDIRVENEYNSFLKKIFTSVDLSIYDWEIITDDVLYFENGEESPNQGIFGSNLVDGNTFVDIISRDRYYMIFMDLKAYPRNAKRVFIQKYQDFIESDCKLVFMCVDSEYIKVYCKDSTILATIYENCIEFKFISVNYISYEQAKERTLVAF